MADTTGDLEPDAEARSGLALAHLHLADPAAALAAAAAAHEFPTEEPRLRLLEGVASSTGSRRPCRPLAMRSPTQRRCWHLRS